MGKVQDGLAVAIDGYSFADEEFVALAAQLIDSGV